MEIHLVINTVICIFGMMSGEICTLGLFTSLQQTPVMTHRSENDVLHDGRQLVNCNRDIGQVVT